MNIVETRRRPCGEAQIIRGTRTRAPANKMANRHESADRDDTIYGGITLAVKDKIRIRIKSYDHKLADTAAQWMQE